MPAFLPEDYLSKEELTILKTFQDSELTWPADTNLTQSQISKALASLEKKQLIKGRRPFKLTKKGVKLLTEH
jgi:DNA-binding MarR family transcriptional regulator